MNVVETIEKTDLHVTPTADLLNLRESMEKQGLHVLPVVENNQFLGLIHIDHIRHYSGAQETIADTQGSWLQISMYDDQHIFDALPLVSAHEIDVIPVINSQHQYVGMMTVLSLIKAINSLLDCEQAGSVLVLEIGQRDNALSHIAHIIESADAQVLASFTRQLPDSTRLEITLKVKGQSLSGVVDALLRYDYTVKTTYNNELDKEDLQLRFEQLMNFINM